MSDTITDATPLQETAAITTPDDPQVVFGLEQPDEEVVEEPVADVSLEPGTRVTYHGSLTDLHGDGTILYSSKSDHPEVTSDDGHRYVVVLDRAIPVSNVTRQSLTPLDQEA